MMDVSANSTEKRMRKSKKRSTETPDAGALQSSNPKISGEEDSDLWISGVKEEVGVGVDKNRNSDGSARQPEGITGEDHGKKRKKKKHGAPSETDDVAAEGGPESARPSGGEAATNGRSWTISLAVAGSIIDNAQSLMLATSVSVL